ncbi:response regulator [Natrarchaeobaculum aegyptiacum]|uniref:Response regulator n=1 Tax=Natrarchaeobaculum aegyptiacum TaxID=745377 RepID=A0A2Z2HQ23_9EURY|nr:response regulator [Natrarchaeobaculum aegyptiacum]ARS89141.1 response regulator [Natrarchaeobaculum aegyptiacum]
MNGDITDSDGRATLTNDELFSVFTHSSRRTVLFHLRQHQAATLEELVDVLAVTSVEEWDAEDRTRMRTELYHRHLPLLEERGLLTHDRAAEVVESADPPGEVGEWLDLAVRQQLRSERTHDPDDRSDGSDQLAVLLVDDEPGLPETIGGYIERENDDITVTIATSTLEAVSTLEEESFDCIVSDYQMPALSGLDFLKAVRERDSAVPFIVFTAKGSERVASEAIATGVTDYVKKAPDPDQFDVLVDRIRAATTRN